MKVLTHRNYPYLDVAIEVESTKVDVGLLDAESGAELALELIDGADDILMAFSISAFDMEEIREIIMKKLAELNK